VTLMTRDQKTQPSFHIRNGKLIEIARTSHPQWIECGLGTPTHIGTSLLVHDDNGGKRTLELAGKTVWDGSRHVDQVIDATEKHMVLAVYNQPWEREIIEVWPDGTFTSISDPDGYAMAITDGRYSVVIQMRNDAMETRYEIKHHNRVIHTIISNQTKSPITPVVKIESRTERDLPTAVLWPEGHLQGSHSLPVIVSIYGGPHHNEVMAAQRSFADDQWLANQGFCVVAIDNAGSLGKSVAREREVHNDLWDVVLRDQVAALKNLGDEYTDMDLNRVGITGWSFGGYLSALAVLERPDVYHAAWAGAPVTDWRMYDTAYTERYLGDPRENGGVYDAGSLILKAAQLSRPLALIHGLADDNVLAAHSLQLSGALLAHGKAHTFLPLAGVSHMTPQIDITKNLMLMMRDFFKANL
jgi:dipeptidyl-peptidase-4